MRKRVSSRATGRRPASIGPAAALVADERAGERAAGGRLGLERGSERGVRQARRRSARGPPGRRAPRAPAIFCAENGVTSACASAGTPATAAAHLRVDALERAVELERAARREALVRVVERGRDRKPLADDRVRDRHFAHHVARIAAAHDDLVRPAPRPGAAAAAAWGPRSPAACRSASRSICSEAACSGSMVRRPPSSAARCARRLTCVRLDAQVVGRIDQPVRGHLAGQPAAQVLERELVAGPRRGPVQAGLGADQPAERRAPRRPARWRATARAA